MSHPISFSIPGVGLIAVLGKHYDGDLTDDFIQQWLYDLYAKYRAEPDYLLCSQRDARALHRLILSDRYLYRFSMEYSRVAREEKSDDWPGEYYPNKVSGSPLMLVVFPGLPPETLFVGNLLKVERETVIQDEGLFTRIERTYTPEFERATMFFDYWKAWQAWQQQRQQDKQEKEEGT